MVFDETNKYVQARADTMQSIEGSISELGQIFNQLAVLVNEQGEMISRQFIIIFKRKNVFKLEEI